MVVAPSLTSLFILSVDLYDWDERDDGKAWTDCAEWRAYEDEPVGEGWVLLVSVSSGVGVFYFLLWFHSLENSFLLPS
jgi:hypothetical protein